MKYVYSLLLILLSTPLLAQEGVFVSPMNASDINLIETALVGRGWKILEQDEQQVRAEVSNVGRGVEAEITIFHTDTGFNYKANAISKKKSPGFGGNTSVTKRYPTEIPDKWLRLLQQDVNKMLLARPTTKTVDFEDRLLELKAIHDKGLISDDEYQTKKIEILSEL